MDGLKKINAELGPETGDSLIADAARVVEGVLRESDIIGRINDDELCIFTLDHSAKALQTRLQNAIDAFNIGSHPFHLSVRIKTDVEGATLDDLMAAPQVENIKKESAEEKSAGLTAQRALLPRCALPEKFGLEDWPLLDLFAEKFGLKGLSLFGLLPDEPDSDGSPLLGLSHLLRLLRLSLFQRGLSPLFSWRSFGSRSGSAGGSAISGGVTAVKSRRLISFSMSRRKLPSVSSQNEIASPPAPARAVRPMRCT